MQPCRSYIPPAPRDTTQKPPEEPSAVAGTSCALRSWHRDLARLPFAILVAALATFASQAMCFVWLQPAGWLETRDQDDKRTRIRTVKSRTGRHHYSLMSICSSREGTATVHTSLKGGSYVWQVIRGTERTRSRGDEWVERLPLLQTRYSAMDGQAA